MLCRPEIQEFKAATLAAGKPMVYNGGPASILCTFPNPNQTYVNSIALTLFVSSLELCKKRASLTRRVLQKPRLPLPDRILRRLLHWHRDLGLPGPGESLRLCRRRSLRHRSRVRYYGLGLRRHLHLYKSSP